MAKYTVELSSMVCAFAYLQDPQGEDTHLSIEDVDSVDLFDYYSHEFLYSQNTNPNKIIDKYGLAFMYDRLTEIPHNFTDNEDLNKEILDRFLKAFIRHFWGREIGQENPHYWYVILQGFFDEHMPIFIQAYQKMMIENQNFITNVADSQSTGQSNANSVSEGTGSSISGTADTPQNELDFKIATGDPTDDYNFNYSSQVGGAKSKDSNTTKSDANDKQTSHSEGRNATIMDLVNQLQQFSNGIYLDMFSRAWDYGLFLSIIS